MAITSAGAALAIVPTAIPRRVAIRTDATRVQRALGWRTIENAFVRLVVFDSGTDVLSRSIFPDGAKTLTIEYATRTGKVRTASLVVDDAIFAALRTALSHSEWVPAPSRRTARRSES
jgi:hypothetical protein